MGLKKLAAVFRCRRKKVGKSTAGDLLEAKEEYMIRSGAVLLEKQVAYGYGKGSYTSRPIRIFSLDEIMKATNNLDDQLVSDRVFSAVKYKGTLEDGRVVSVESGGIFRNKNRCSVDLTLNEVVVNQIISHKSVRKLHGCCLETFPPILVYEFLPNFTLSDHIHGRARGGKTIPRFNLPWSESLRIAAEISHALSYMHLALPKPIVHLDIHPGSIYLDENFNAKLGNFKCSVAITPGEEFISDLDAHELGYDDPEYITTHRVTEKCDVYSFGIVLVELLTGERPSMMEGFNFGEYFARCLKQVGGVLGIVHPRVLREAAAEEIRDFAGITMRCLASRGEDRPTIREVAIELQRMHLAAKQKAKMMACLDPQGLKIRVQAEHLSLK